MRRCCSFVAVAAAAVVCGAARADIAPDVAGAGPGFAPPADHPAARAIAMQKEKVTLTLHRVDEGERHGAFVVVDAVFTMAAPTKEGVKLRVAFPGQGVQVGDAYAVHPALVGFRAFVDGKPVAARAEEKTQTTKSGPPGREYTKTRKETWHVFPAVVDDSTVVRVRYAVAAEPFDSRAGGELEEAPQYAKARYILHTGSLWQGAIGEAVVEVAGHNVDVEKTSLRTLTMPGVSLVSLASDGPPPPVSPPGAARTKTSITATWKNLEPTPDDDVEVVFPAQVTWEPPATFSTAMEQAALSAAVVNPADRAGAPPARGAAR